MIHMGLSDKVLVTTEIQPQSAGAGAVNGAGVDMQGWEGVMFLINVGAITGSGTFDARAVSDDNSGFNSVTNITGQDASGANANAAIAQATAANGVHILEVYRPTERYVRLIGTVAVNTVAFGASAIRYRRAGILPPTQSAVQRVLVRQN